MWICLSFLNAVERKTATRSPVDGYNLPDSKRLDLQSLGLFAVPAICQKALVHGPQGLGLLPAARTLLCPLADRTLPGVWVGGTLKSNWWVGGRRMPAGEQGAGCGGELHSCCHEPLETDGLMTPGFCYGTATSLKATEMRSWSQEDTAPKPSHICRKAACFWQWLERESCHCYRLQELY